LLTAPQKPGKSLGDAKASPLPFKRARHRLQLPIPDGKWSWGSIFEEC